MAYLQKSDYTISVSLLHLDEILAAAVEASGKTDDQVRQEAENTAQAMIEAYVSASYDTATEYAKLSTDITRASMVIKCTVDISLYYLHMTINPRNIPALRQSNYDACEDYLNKVRKGTMTLTGVSLLPDTSRVDFTTITSQRKFVSKSFTDRSILDGDTL